MQVDVAGSYADADEGAAQVVSAQVLADAIHDNAPHFASCGLRLL